MRLVGGTVCALLVLIGSGSPTRSSPSPVSLAWAPPVLRSPVVVTVPDTDGRVVMDTSRDYVVQLGHLAACGGLALVGGRNVVVLGGEVTIPAGCVSAYDRTAIKVVSNAGTVHLEGILVDGPYTHDGIVTASPGTTLQVENVRVEGVRTLDAEHPDCFQTQGGLGRLRVDRFTCSTELQGFFLKREGGLAVGPVDIRNTDITGTPGKHLFFQNTPDIPVALTNVWLYSVRPWAPFGFLVFPQKDGLTLLGGHDRSRRAVVARGGGRLWFVGSNIRGVVRKGPPPAGEMVPAGVAGFGYSSPGYRISRGAASTRG